VIEKLYMCKALRIMSAQQSQKLTQAILYRLPAQLELSVNFELYPRLSSVRLYMRSPGAPWSLP